jgi:prepilin-type N-terminal cleavage/methylation domain-containing protein
MQRGFSLIELLIVAAVSALFFAGLFSSVQSALKLVADSRARMSALSVANEQLEYIRSLSYDSVGTVSGLPPGIIPQISTTTLNGILFTRRVLVEYIDDPADGLNAADSNGITTDYKQAKIEVSWNRLGTDQSIFLISNIVPRSIETDVGGGTVRVNVFDANALPVAGASVRLLNTTGTTTVDVTRLTDATGVALFGGAPAQSDYQLFVSRAGYSSDQTHMATGTLINPASGPFAVLEADVTTKNFSIDRLSTMLVRLLSSYSTGSIENNLATSSDVTTTTNTEIVSDNLVLTQSLGVYALSGNALLPVMTPSPLVAYEELAVNDSVPANTARRIQFFSGSTSDTIIPDVDLPGNSSGFTGRINLRSLNATAYPNLYIKITLETSNTAVTPEIRSVTLHYRTTESLVTNQNFTFTSDKSIGTDALLQPIPKHVYSTSTNSSGERQFDAIEWGAYRTSIAPYDIAEACYSEPRPVSPNSNTLHELLLVGNTAHSLRVEVTDSLGAPVRDATVRLIRGSTDTAYTSGCGQAFFSGVNEEPDYRLEVTAPTYGTTVIDPLSVSGDTVQAVTI